MPLLPHPTHIQTENLHILVFPTNTRSLSLSVFCYESGMQLAGLCANTWAHSGRFTLMKETLGDLMNHTRPVLEL